MTQRPSRADFFLHMASALAALSKALLRASFDLAAEAKKAAVRALKKCWHLWIRFSKFVWSSYYSLESRIVRLIADIMLTLYAVRVFIGLIFIGIALGYWHQWFALIIYILFLVVAAIFYLKFDEEEKKQAIEMHMRWRSRVMSLLRWVLRSSIAALSLIYICIQWNLLEGLHYNTPNILTSSPKSEIPSRTHQQQPMSLDPMDKGSSYFIPKLREQVAKFRGTSVSTVLNLDTHEDVLKACHIFLYARAQVGCQGQVLTISGDLGEILGNVLEVCDALFKNDGKTVSALYGQDEIDVLVVQWNVLSKMDKELKKQKKIEESNAISMVINKGIEPSYNYYNVEARK